MPGKFMVTGAGGFIGSRLCARLLEGGFDVHATSRTARRDEDDGVRWWQLDLADPGAVRDALDAVEPDVVIHLASQVTGVRQVALVLPTFHANLASTVNLLAATAERGHGRVVIAGSMEEPEHPGDVPSSPYAASKWAADGYARMFHLLYGCPLSPPSAYLHGLRPRDAGRDQARAVRDPLRAPRGRSPEAFQRLARGGLDLRRRRRRGVRRGRRCSGRGRGANSTWARARP